MGMVASTCAYMWCNETMRLDSGMEEMPRVQVPGLEITSAQKGCNESIYHHLKLFTATTLF